MKEILRAADPHPSNAKLLDLLTRRALSPQVSMPRNEFLSLPDTGDSYPPTLPLVRPINRKQSLTRTKSLTSVTDHAAPPSGKLNQSSTADDSFFPPYIKRLTHERRPQAPGGLDPMGFECSVPISRRYGRPPTSELPYSDSVTNVALWDGTDRETMEHVMQMNVALGTTAGGLSPPRTSLAGEWHAMLGGG
jgi:hypothetical protein